MYPKASSRCFLSLTSSSRAGVLPGSSVVHSRHLTSSAWLASVRAPPLCSKIYPNINPIKRRRFHASALNRAQRDPYQVLGVSKDASAADIKKSYFQLARKYHPDSSKEVGAKDKFIEIQQAYDTLGDEKKRDAYDRYGAASQQPGFDPDAFANARGPFGAGFGGFQDFSSAFGAGTGGSQSELFEQLFGAFGGGTARPRAQRSRGADIEASVNISFIDACKGVTRTLNLNPVVDCSRCSGSGLKPGTKKTKCHSCGGTGTRTYVIDSGFQMASTCTTCQGSGQYVSKDAQCGDCSGVGKVKTSKAISVDIPAGVEDGMVIRVPSAGDKPVRGSGPSGDLVVRVNVAASRTFHRQGVHLLQQVRIPLHIAMLGGRVRVPTLDGDVEVKVSPGTQPGEECVLRGRGVVPVMGGSKGDMFVSFQVQIPRALSDRQRELMQLFADEAERRAKPSDGKSDNGGLYDTSRDGREGQPTRPEDGDHARDRDASGSVEREDGMRKAAASGG